VGPRDGNVVVDLIEPGCDPILWINVVQQEVFRDAVPWVVIRISLMTEVRKNTTDRRPL
jgi:hypothetical protein